MKKSKWLLSTIILAIALAMLFSVISCQKQDTETDITAIKEMLNQYEAEEDAFKRRCERLTISLNQDD